MKHLSRSEDTLQQGTGILGLDGKVALGHAWLVRWQDVTATVQQYSGLVLWTFHKLHKLDLITQDKSLCICF